MDPSRSKDVEKSSLCNCVVNFLLEENYILTAFELLQELVEDGRNHLAIRLRDFFADESLFPPDQIARLNVLRVADPQSLQEEKESLGKKLAISDYELRLCQEDVSRLKLELQKKIESRYDDFNGSSAEISGIVGLDSQLSKREKSFDLGSLKDIERRDLNCAVKEYLLLAGYKLTAMSFYEEVTNQNLDVWPKSAACVSDALRHYYYQYLSSTDEAAEEKLTLILERDSLLKENERLTAEQHALQKSRDLSGETLARLEKALESTKKDLKERDMLVQSLKQTLELQRKELNDCRSEITSLKMHIEGLRVGQTWTGGDTEPFHTDSYKEETKSLPMEMESLKEENASTSSSNVSNLMNEEKENGDKFGGRDEDEKSHSNESFLRVSNNGENGDMIDTATVKPYKDSSNGNTTVEKYGSAHIQESGSPSDDKILVQSPINRKGQIASDKMGFETIQILSEALPKIVPYVLINHREELVPLIMCAIEHHPESTVRDSLTHTLFNLIKRPDEKQRRIIMDACVTLAKNVGEMRTETELLPQCWEQINHNYEERRLLVAQSCGELAEFVHPEIRDSLILSILQQLVEDSATVVRAASARNLALLLPLFPNFDKYFKVEDLLFQLQCDPSGSVVETTLRELIPSVVKWGDKLDHILRVLHSHILSFAQRCQPLSEVEGTVDCHLRVLGDQERWNIKVLLRMLTRLLPFVYENAIKTCPFTSSELLAVPLVKSEPSKSFFSITVLELYTRGHVEWPAFDWLHVECFPSLIQLSCLLPTKEDNLRYQIAKFLLDVSACYGDDYLTHVMLPVFLLAAGDDADLAKIPSSTQPRINGLRPKTVVAERLAIMCVLPLLLVGIMGVPGRQEQLGEYLRKLLLQKTMREGSWSAYHTADLIDAIRFLSMQQEHHGMILNILWEMVVSSNLDLKIFAANLLKVLVSYIDEKVASTHILPALVTLGSDQNMDVKYASIDAFGSVVQYFKNDMMIDKIRIQMDAFLEDGSHEATIAVVRALTVAVPHTIDRLREYLLSKIYQLTSLLTKGNDVARHRERVNVFYEAIRALDATDLPATSVREFLLPAVQNLLKEADALDPAHKEALEVIIKERYGGKLETMSKVKGAHLGIASSVTTFFGESGIRVKKERGGDAMELEVSVLPRAAVSPKEAVIPKVEDTGFRKMIRGNFGSMFKRQTEEQ